ncbi:glycosyltransferase involved in cell wall biosynthesis [Agromyces hippuratus]|uniref:Glycosyltransferase involved in cell wall biosynthesis n=1 Tax=Agromyces hippuratus TaxID=286438 RepID=A0A852WRC8_9MICO|nr:glycosyltransferase family 1 protein [Agromyces hippuratus]NYG20529.1 glycosyltransferase involved in cell wall biosynthesis [Agromyces hippuratus]
MPTTLRMIVDQVIAPVPGPLGVYSEALTRALIQVAPPGCEVEGIVSSSAPADTERLESEFPGLAGLYKTTLARRELAAAWQLGLTTSPGGGMIHAPGLFAPLRRHDRTVSGDQVVVTVHDLLAWTHPESLTTASVAWHKGMLKRARKHADAVVVPTHALAERLANVADFGDRVRVIGTAPRPGLVAPSDAADVAARAARLALPPAYLVATGTLEPRKGVLDLLEALGRPGMPDIDLVVIGPSTWGELHLATVAEEAGVDPRRVHAIDTTDAADLSVILAGATAFVAPSHDEGSGTSLIEAFSLGLPVVHSDIAAYVEVAAEGGLTVPIGIGGGYTERLAAAISTVVESPTLAERLSVTASDRAHAFSWRDSAERVWQLHADL